MPARIVLGVGAGIAAYKVCELLRRFTETGHQVRVVPTDESLRFVGAATWAALSGEPVGGSVWDGVDGIGQDLACRRVIVRAGGPREELDPVRFLGNWSSGRQGYALAATAVARGAEVTVVSANVDLPAPAGATVVPVTSTRELQSA